jgi:hypothetical protein
MAGRRKMQGLAWAFGLAFLAGAAGCAPAPPPAFPTVLAETPAQAQSVLTCETIARERAAIAASRERLHQQQRLAERDGELAELEASKGCAQRY